MGLAVHALARIPRWAARNLGGQFIFDGADSRCRVLRSALVRLRTYYAAVERVRTTGERDVAAVVCLVRYNPHDREGYVFGYKDSAPLRC